MTKEKTKHVSFVVGENTIIAGNVNIEKAIMKLVRVANQMGRDGYSVESVEFGRHPAFEGYRVSMMGKLDEELK